jgi:hypothetical protein
MKMLVTALIGGVVLGFVDASMFLAQIQKHVVDPGTQALVATGLAAFLGVIWGWVGKGMIGGKSKE